MPVVTCAERTSTEPEGKDAGWVTNGTDNQLFYPYVSSCVTVTLVFDNGLLGGHASQVTTDSKNPQFKAAENLLAVLERMASAAPESSVRGAFKKIYFIGTTSASEWKLDQAKDVIAKKFGQPSVTEPTKFNLSPVDVVFDTNEKKIYSVIRKDKTQGAAKTIEEAKEAVSEVEYV
ncbi:MAG TPA: hypothetical protein VJ810_29395 [Blastocatellia bacterium]|nr:hypothetical protein [Blastocatellia bacterium]